ncbi:hypothetical protein AAFC00_006482 [Neodothiora populina]|uniref:Enoyl reductase (ER) domain-containing protein n=1 Tax=Neodothiora populina TaxID=2781224 RepID=A0ABR3P5C5_9PEZI
MSVPTSHSAAILPKAKGTHEVQARPTPSLGPDEVLIRIIATAINPVDWKIRDYAFLLSEYPAVLGSDAAGEVVLTGTDVKSFTSGDRVFFQGILGNYDSSTFQQYCKMPASLLGKTPKSISDEQAAGVCLATLAVIVGLYDKSGQGLAPPPWAEGGDQVGKGKAAIIIGGSSSVGQYAIQFARLSGFERIITNSSAAHEEYLKSLGATTVLDRSKATPKDFKDAAGGCEVTYVQDTISSTDTQTLAVEILRQFNRGNVITVMPAVEEAVKMGKDEAHSSVQVKQIMGFGSSPALRYLSEPLMKALGGEDGWLATGKFTPNRTELTEGGLYALEKALEKNKKGVSGIKVVIRPFDVEHRML